MTDDGMPRRLPNAARAIVEERRIREYLLNLNHATGGPKARFFIAHGFASDAWNLLQASLTIHGREQDNQKHRHRVGYPPHGGMQLPNSGRAQPMHPDRMANGRRRTASADGDPAVGLPGWALCDIPFFVAPSLSQGAAHVGFSHTRTASLARRPRCPWRLCLSGGRRAPADR